MNLKNKNKRRKKALGILYLDDELKQKEGHQESRDDCVILSLKKKPLLRKYSHSGRCPLVKFVSWFSPRLH